MELRRKVKSVKDYNGQLFLLHPTYMTDVFGYDMITRYELRHALENLTVPDGYGQRYAKIRRYAVDLKYSDDIGYSDGVLSIGCKQFLPKYATMIIRWAEKWSVVGILQAKAKAKP